MSLFRDLDPDEREEIRREFRPVRRQTFTCYGPDFCGAEDCERCRPGSSKKDHREDENEA